jgi:hypothetical protein
LALALAFARKTEERIRIRSSRHKQPERIIINNKEA